MSRSAKKDTFRPFSRYESIPVKSVLISILFLFSFVHDLPAQSVLNTPVSGTFDDLTIVEFLEILENRLDIRIYYDPGKIPFFKHSYTFDKTPLYEAVDQFLKGSTLDLIKYRDNLLIAEKNYITSEFIENLIAKWNDGTFKKPLLEDALEIYSYFGDSLNPQQGLIVLKGTVKDKYTDDPIVSAVLKDQNSDYGTTTDEFGTFELKSEPGHHSFTISYLGYQNINLRMDWYASDSIDLQMEVFALNLSEVIVEATAQQNKVTTTQIGIEMISTREIKALPSLLGEADILKSIERLPGVNTVSEASAGFNVRGGNIDQNLILLDDGILFNASHALGFFSIFNPDAVRSVTLYKGGIPTQYGGRLSSVLNVDIKDGNRSKWKGSGAVSLASARLVTEGPVTDNTTLVLGARTSYSNWLLGLFRNPDIRNSRFSFHDFVTKVSHTISNKHFVTATGYLSDDYFRYSNEFGYEWSTRLLSLKWRYLISDRISWTSSFSTGTYKSGQFIPTGDLASSLENGISNKKLVSNVIFQNKIHFINIGFEGISYQMHPERIRPLSDLSDIVSQQVKKNHAVELALYAHDEYKLSEVISISGGLRMANFIALGPSVVQVYDPEKPRSSQSIIGSETFGKNKREISYLVLEPRLSVNIKINKNNSAKISYNRINQFLHLVSNTVSPTPVDIWQLSNSYFKPEIGNSYSVGYFRNIGEKWNYAIEGFYKTINHFPQFKDFAELQLNETLETQLLPGDAKSYGVEFGLERSTGSLTGALAYTFSRSLAQTNGIISEEIINNNQWYPVHFDQPHQLNFQIQWNIDPIQKIYLGITYKSGRPITVPFATYELQDVLITHYSQRNQFRVPYFLRIDFGYTLDRSQVKLRGVRSNFVFSFINLLSRSNPYSIYFRRDSRNIQRAYKLSILGTLFPSLNWNFTF